MNKLLSAELRLLPCAASAVTRGNICACSKSKGIRFWDTKHTYILFAASGAGLVFGTYCGEVVPRHDGGGRVCTRCICLTHVTQAGVGVAAGAD